MHLMAPPPCFTAAISRHSPWATFSLGSRCGSAAWLILHNAPSFRTNSVDQHNQPTSLLTIILFHSAICGANMSSTPQKQPVPQQASPATMGSVISYLYFKHSAPRSKPQTEVESESDTCPHSEGKLHPGRADDRPLCAPVPCGDATHLLVCALQLPCRPAKPQE